MWQLSELQVPLCIVEVFDPTAIFGWNLYLTMNYLLVYVCHGLTQDLSNFSCLSEEKGVTPYISNSCVASPNDKGGYQKCCLGGLSSICVICKSKTISLLKTISLSNQGTAASACQVKHVCVISGYSAASYRREFAWGSPLPSFSHHSGRVTEDCREGKAFQPFVTFCLPTSST